MSPRLPDVPDLSDDALPRQVAARLAEATGVADAFGRAGVLAAQLARLQDTASPHIGSPQALVFAGDHGVALRGVSTLPADGTRRAAASLLAGTGPVAVLCRSHGVGLHVVDCGLRPGRDGESALGPAAPPAVLHVARVDGHAGGAEDSSRTIAMSPGARNAAIDNGVRLMQQVPGNAVLIGTIGVGGSSSAALLMALLTGTPIEQCTGRGVGLDGAGVARRITVLRMAMQRHARATDPLNALASVGGLETATMVGAVLQAAHERRVLLVDGFGATAAVAIAARLAPAVLQRCVFAHRGADSGLGRWLERLGVDALLDLDIRIGDGSGALLAWPLLPAACALLAAG